MITKTFSGYRSNGNHSIWVQRSSHDLHNAPPVHQHDFIELIYVIHGAGIHYIGTNDYSIHPGDIYVVKPGETHKYELKSEIEIINCLFLPEAIRDILPLDSRAATEMPYISPIFHTKESFIPSLSLHSHQSSVILRLLEELLREMKFRQSGADILIANKLIEILILLSRYSEQYERPQLRINLKMVQHEILVRQIKEFLERSFQDKITLPILSEHFNISERHMNRIFKHATGMSVIEMLQQIRIERAKHLLTETDRNIEMIAKAVGFGDTSHFSRLFHRKTGYTPGVYRKRVKKSRLTLL